jgi:thioredoxin 2
MHVVCSFCMAVNRIPSERLKDHPKCGRCHREILNGQAIILGEGNFETYVGRSDLPVIVDFWADWCGPCKMMAPVIEQLAGELAGRVCFAKVDVDSEQTLARRFGIRSIPTLMLFKSGKEVDRVTGAMSGANLRNWIFSH